MTYLLLGKIIFQGKQTKSYPGSIMIYLLLGKIFQGKTQKLPRFNFENPSTPVQSWAILLGKIFLRQTKKKKAITRTHVKQSRPDTCGAIPSGLMPSNLTRLTSCPDQPRPRDKKQNLTSYPDQPRRGAKSRIPPLRPDRSGQGGKSKISHHVWIHLDRWARFHT